VAQDVHAWTSAFWPELVRLDDGWRHSVLTGDCREHRLVIESTDAKGGTIVISRRTNGRYVEIARHAFVSADSAVLAAGDIVRLIRAQRYDSAIELMDKDAFISTLHRAVSDADDAARVRENLEMWAHRLLPYLERQPDLTVAQALALYRSDSERQTG